MGPRPRRSLRMPGLEPKQGTVYAILSGSSLHLLYWWYSRWGDARVHDRPAFQALELRKIAISFVFPLFFLVSFVFPLFFALFFPLFLPVLFLYLLYSYLYILISFILTHTFVNDARGPPTRVFTKQTRKTKKNTVSLSHLLYSP